MSIRKRVKLTPITRYLSQEMKLNKSLGYTITNLDLNDTYAETFQEEFGKMSPK